MGGGWLLAHILSSSFFNFLFVCLFWLVSVGLLGWEDVVSWLFLLQRRERDGEDDIERDREEIREIGWN